MAHRKKFTLRSTGPFKMMGSSSPIRQEDNDTPKDDDTPKEGLILWQMNNLGYTREKALELQYFNPDGTRMSDEQLKDLTDRQREAAWQREKAEREISRQTPD
jgi:hypothetical protein